MVIGLGVVVLVYLSSRLFDLYTVNWILDNFLSSVLLVIVIIFQNDIRRALVQVGSRPVFGGDLRLGGQDLEEIIRAVVTGKATARLPRVYWSFAEARKWAEKGQTPWTPAVSVLFGLRVGVRRLIEEGRGPSGSSGAARTDR